MCNAYKILVRKPKGWGPNKNSTRRWEDNIQMDLKEIALEDAHWNHLAQDTEEDRVGDVSCVHGNELSGSTKDEIFFFFA
jgi:hypothetical protein